MNRPSRILLDVILAIAYMLYTNAAHYVFLGPVVFMLVFATVSYFARCNILHVTLVALSLSIAINLTYSFSLGYFDMSRFLLICFEGLVFAAIGWFAAYVLLRTLGVATEIVG